VFNKEIISNSGAPVLEQNWRGGRHLTLVYFVPVASHENLKK
jgi:hypothetical protein